MRRRALITGLGLLGAGACANILGIDDGTPRQYDASMPDVSDNADAPPDVGVVVEAGVDAPATSPLLCGKSTCNALAEACCRKGDPLDASTQTFGCITDAAACATGLVVTCDETTTCDALGHSGDVCCAEVADGGSVAIRTRCIPRAQCNGNIMCQPGDDEVCDPDAGQSCQPSISTIVGWDVCKT